MWRKKMPYCILILLDLNKQILKNSTKMINWSLVSSFLAIFKRKFQTNLTWLSKYLFIFDILTLIRKRRWLRIHSTKKCERRRERMRKKIISVLKHDSFNFFLLVIFIVSNNININDFSSVNKPIETNTVIYVDYFFILVSTFFT